MKEKNPTQPSAVKCCLWSLETDFKWFFKMQRLTALEMPFLGLLSSIRLLATTEAYFV